MELKINVFRLVAFAALIITIIIGIFILRHQNNAIRILNDVIMQEQLDDSLQQATDSIKFKQLQLKTFSDSMATAKLYRDREAELIKKLIKKKIMDMPWAVRAWELSEAIPPCYTEYIGKQLLKYESNIRI